MRRGIATFPMYDWPEVSEDWDTFWNLLANRLDHQGISAPAKLSRCDDPFLMWQDPLLLIGQTCGWPYVNLLADDVHAIARFDHGLPDAPAGTYYSVFVGQPDEVRTPGEILQSDSTIAVNGFDSQSGFRVLRELDRDFVDEPPLERIITSGSHRDSVALVARGEADLAAIDAVSLELARSFDPALVSKIRPLSHSIPKPALPLVTSTANLDKAPDIFLSLKETVNEMPNSLKKRLCIYDVISADRSVYQVFAEKG